MIILFEDNGQPYRAWKVDINGKIIGCYPKQGFYWLGKYVCLSEPLKAGQHLHYCDTEIAINEKIKIMRHKIAAIKNQL